MCRGIWWSMEADRRAYGMSLWQAGYSLLTLSTWWLVVLYRAAHYLKEHNIRFIPRLLHALGIALWGSDISPAAVIGVPLRIAHSVGIVIGENCVIGDNCEIFHNVTIGGRGQPLANGSDAMPVIGDNVTLCAGAVVIGLVRVGDGVIVGANSVVLRDVLDHTSVAGVPAEMVGKVEVPHALRSLTARRSSSSRR
jgi:serine O-acetyltransferase